MKMMQDAFEEIGICSFSLLDRGFDEPLLWSHYADEHRGVCLLYEFSESFLSDSGRLIGTDKIIYGDNPLTTWLATVDMPFDNAELNMNLVRRFLTSKALDWQYEKEVRIIAKANGPFQIEKGMLKQVCFGLRTPQADMALIMRLARIHSGCESFHKVIHNETDFGLTTEEIVDP